MNDYEYGPKYPVGEIIFVEEVGWVRVNRVAWRIDKWVYLVELPIEEKEFEVEEWQILY
jgi:hypothetical protein